jgi:hypothetical protein
LREWLDRNSRRLVRFDTAANDNAIIINVQFDAVDLASTFRHDFNGDYDREAEVRGLIGDARQGHVGHFRPTGGPQS